LLHNALHQLNSLCLALDELKELQHNMKTILDETSTVLKWRKKNSSSADPSRPCSEEYANH
jgi:hypothetical protein